jgi:predicted nicotinamide N-methyase
MDALMTRLHDRLLDRIGRRFQTRTEFIRLGKLDLTFTRIAEPDRVLDDAVAQEERRHACVEASKSDPPRMPYWAELWESATALGQIITRTLGANASVLDLGCGMGLAGAAAAAMGAEVTMADLETTPLLLARLNTLPWRHRVRVRRVNWQTDRLPDRFDLILGADILYERGQWEFLDAFWQAHLKLGGKVLLGEPGRSTGDAFPAWIAARGWAVRTSSEPIAGVSRPVRVFQLNRLGDGSGSDSRSQ